MNIISYFHTHIPDPVAFSLGPITIYWYGVIMALSIIVALLLTVHLGRRRGVNTQYVLDAATWAIVGGLIGARLYEIFLEWNYYSEHPAQIIKFWNGGLAIHGAIIGAFIALYIFAKHEKKSVWEISGLIIPGLALGQAIGRFGNWFNQELFGLPTNRAWGIPIELAQRPWDLRGFSYFHPVFFYEAAGLVIIAVITYLMLRNKSLRTEYIVASYLILAGALRFSLEYIKSDPTPMIGILRWPQIFSLGLIILGIILSVSVLKIKKAKPF